MAYIVTAGLWLFCCVELMVGTHDEREVLNTDQDIDVLQIITSLQTEVAFLKSEARERNKRILLHSDQDVQQVIASLQAEVASLKSNVATLLSNATTFESQVSSLQSLVATLQSNILSAPLTSGSVYVRWGRTSCPGNGTEMVYRGRMAGSMHNSYGGGSNSLCLPDDPTWAKYMDGLNVRGKIYGTEIEVPGDLANLLFGKGVTDQDVPCAVCRTVRPSNVMVPARANCYPGWTMEYSGYVVTAGETWPNNYDYVCLDSGLEFAPHGAASDNEHVIVVVEVVCGKAGSLPCPPFVNGREAACVVCSK